MQGDAVERGVALTARKGQLRFLLPVIAVKGKRQFRLLLPAADQLAVARAPKATPARKEPQRLQKVCLALGVGTADQVDAFSRKKCVRLQVAVPLVPQGKHLHCAATS